MYTSEGMPRCIEFMANQEAIWCRRRRTSAITSCRSMWPWQNSHGSHCHIGFDVLLSIVLSAFPSYTGMMIMWCLSDAYLSDSKRVRQNTVSDPVAHRVSNCTSKCTSNVPFRVPKQHFQEKYLLYTTRCHGNCTRYLSSKTDLEHNPLSLYDRPEHNHMLLQRCLFLFTSTATHDITY